MRNYVLLLSLFFLVACSPKNEQVVVTNLKTQTLMFSKKQKVELGSVSAVFTMSYLNPVLDVGSQDDVFALTITPSTLDFESLEVFINGRSANVELLSPNDELTKYLIHNGFSDHLKIFLPGIKSENKLEVLTCLNHSTCFELNFSKYPKSLYYRSKDVDTQYN